MRDCADKVPVKIVEPATEAGRRLDLWLAEADIRWPDELTRIAPTAIRPHIVSIESQARTRGAELATEALRRNQKTEIVWFLEHNKNASDADIIDGVLLILGIER